MGQFAKKRAPLKKPGAVLDMGGTGGFIGGHPALWEYLTLDVDEDAQPRQTTSFLVVCDNGQLKAWINDRENVRTAWVSAGSWEALWAAVEEALRSDDADWRAVRATGRQARRR